LLKFVKFLLFFPKKRSNFAVHKNSFQIMKNAFKFAVLSLVAVFVFSCSGGSGPEKVAQSYLDAFYAEDYEKAKEFSTEETKGFLDFMKNISAMSGEKKEETKEKKEIKDLKCTIEGDTAAVCTYMIDDKATNAAKEEKLNLRKSGDKWLVNQPKENPMDAAGEGAMGGEPMPADSNMMSGDTSAVPSREAK